MSNFGQMITSLKWKELEVNFMGKSNVELLHEANALDGQDLSDEQLEMLNKEFSAEEMKTLVKLRTAVMDHPTGKKGTGGGVF